MVGFGNNDGGEQGAVLVVSPFGRSAGGRQSRRHGSALRPLSVGVD